jgi:hypothetical protein
MKARALMRMIAGRLFGPDQINFASGSLPDEGIRNGRNGIRTKTC